MHCMESASVMELGLSDHQAKLLPILYEHGSVNAEVWKSHVGESNIKDFQYLLSKMTLQEVLMETG